MVRICTAAANPRVKSFDLYNVLQNVDHVRDTLGEWELLNELTVLKRGENLLSLRSLLNGSLVEQNQHYDFLFVHESGKPARENWQAF